MTMTDYPLVTVVTPSYNQGQFLESTLRSVLEQNYPNLEYIVIDGGSTDNSVEILRVYSDRLAYWVSEKDKGQSHAINKGLARATGEFIGWLNSDDVLMPGAIYQVVSAFQKNPEVDAVYGRLGRIDDRNQNIPTPALPKDNVIFNNLYALDECVVNQAGCFWRRNMMDIVGLLNENLHYSMDYDYWMRMLLAGGKFMRLGDTLALFRLSSGSKTVGQTTNMALEGLEVINSYLGMRDIVDRLGLTRTQLLTQANKGRASVSLHAFYGCVKERRWKEAIKWFIQAHTYNPLVLFNRKWLDLVVARLSRRQHL